MKQTSITSFCFYALIIFASVLLPVNSKAQYQWSYPGATSGFNGNIRASAVYNGELYVGGDFTTVDNGAIAANYLAKWNGTSWSAVGSGLSDKVRSLYVYNAELYVGGYFATAGGVAAVRIAKWNGTTWSAVGTGVGASGVPYTFAEYGGVLYMGGEYATVDGVAVNNIAKWNGTAWSAVGNTGNGMNNSVYGLCVYNGNLYCGGTFSYADYVCCASGVACGGFAKWDGTNFSAPGTGITGSWVYKDMVVYNNELYVPGVFSTMNGVTANNIAKYDGTNWTAVGSGVSGGGGNAEINPLVVFNSELYAGGYFTSADGVAASRIAKWDGTTWSVVGTGMSADIRTLCVYNNKIYAGGSFATASGNAANKIARWHNPTLPITLLSFKAWNEGTSTKLEWVTATETNNDYFTVERSADGIVFEAIATVEGGGTSSKNIAYSTIDMSPMKEVSYYRLKQTDYDGQFSYSQLIDVNVNINQATFRNIFPNPTSGEFTLTLPEKNENPVLVVIQDVLGREVFCSNVSITDISRSNIITVAPDINIHSGIYYVIASSNNKIYKTKLIISR